MRAAVEGYCIIILFSVIETIIVVTLLYCKKRLTRLTIKQSTIGNESEFFVTAGRSLKTGVVANAIAAQWIWPATLLQRCTRCHAAPALLAP